MKDGFIILIEGSQGRDSWALDNRDSVLLGRRDREWQDELEGIDLWPDQLVSRRHASLCFRSGRWWIEDLASRHGTSVGGARLEPGEARALAPWLEIRIGKTVLMLAGPNWHRLRFGSLTLDLEVSPASSLALAHTGVPIVSRVMVRNCGDRQHPPCLLKIALPGFGRIRDIPLPAIETGREITVFPDELLFDYAPFEGLIESCARSITIQLEGSPELTQEIPCRVLACNEWSTSPDYSHRLSLAGFVQPNHPLVSCITADAFQGAALDREPLDTARRLYDYFRKGWNMDYRLEPPSFEHFAQKIRLPHQAVLDFTLKKGFGTCLDLAVLMAACLEHLKAGPMIAIVDRGECFHALAGCRTGEGVREPLLVSKDQALEEAIWFDPTGLTGTGGQRLSFDESMERAAVDIGGQQLQFALDISEARRYGVKPLPFSGTPQWSKEAGQAIERAGRITASAGSDLSLVPLLLALLSESESITRVVFRGVTDNIDSRVEALIKALPRSARPGRSSYHCRQALHLAQSMARDEGSPMVLESHLFAAMLEIRSRALDNVLSALGVDRDRMRSLLLEYRRENALSANSTGFFGTPSHFEIP